MATETVHVNGNSGSANWGTYDYTNLQSTEHTSTPSSSPYIHAGPSDDNETQAYTCANPSNTGTVTSATLWFYGYNSGSDSAGFLSRISLGGSWQSSKTGIALGTDSWNSKTWSGLSSSMTGLNPIIEFTSPTLGKADDVYIRAAYIELTYSAGGSNPNGGSGPNTARLIPFLFGGNRA